MELIRQGFSVFNGLAKPKAYAAPRAAFKNQETGPAHGVSNGILAMDPAKSEAAPMAYVIGLCSVSVGMCRLLLDLPTADC